MVSQREMKDGAAAYRPRMSVLICAAIAGLFLAGSTLSAQMPPPRPNNDNVKREPFRIIDNIYWVGHSEVGSFLITTPEGNILLDTTSTDDWPWVRENIEKLGYQLSDIKIIINSHPHEEHMGGMAMFKELTGAKLIASEATASVMADGGRSDFREDGSEQYKPVKADGTVADGGKVTLGGVTLVAHITPGHTKGAVTWTTIVEEGGQKYNVVFFGGVAVHGIDRAPLLNNPRYPNIAEDFAKAFRVLKSLPCDVFLYVRASTIKLDQKLERLEQGEKPNPFIDPKGCRDYITEYEQRFLDQLEQERGTR